MKDIKAFNNHIIVADCKQISGGRPITQSADTEIGTVNSSCNIPGLMTNLLSKGTKIIFHNGNEFKLNGINYCGVNVKDIIATISK